MTLDLETQEGRSNWAVVRMLTQDLVVERDMTINDVVKAAEIRGISITTDEAAKLWDTIRDNIKHRRTNLFKYNVVEAD